MTNKYKKIALFYIIIIFFLISFPSLLKGENLFPLQGNWHRKFQVAQIPKKSLSEVSGETEEPTSTAPKAPPGLLPEKTGPRRKIRFALAGPVGLKIQTGFNYFNPEWRTTFQGGEQEIDLQDLKLWETRIGFVFPFLDFFFEPSMTFGAVIDGKVENFNQNGGSTTKFNADISGFSIHFQGDLYHQIFKSDFYIRLGFQYAIYKFYADSASASSATSPAGGGVAGLDSWYRMDWLDLKLGFYHLPGRFLSGLFWGVDFIPGFWFFGKGRDKHEDSRFEQGTSEVFGKGGWGFSGLMGYHFYINSGERILFGFEWKYLKVSDGYFKRTTNTFYRRSRMVAETGSFWIFIRYERSF